MDGMVKFSIKAAIGIFLFLLLISVILPTVISTNLIPFPIILFVTVAILSTLPTIFIHLFLSKIRKKVKKKNAKNK